MRLMHAIMLSIITSYEERFSKYINVEGLLGGSILLSTVITIVSQHDTHSTIQVT